MMQWSWINGMDRMGLKSIGLDEVGGRSYARGVTENGEEQIESAHEREGRWVWLNGSWFWVLVGLLVAYPLSVGPAAWVLFRVPWLERAFGIVYAPIGYLCNEFPAVGRAVDWYLVDVWKLPG
jgi:hypothetical protein